MLMPGPLAAVGAAGLDFGLDQLSGAINWKRQKKMFNMINEYNAPKAQMQRLEEAGLNPNLIYGSKGQSGGMASSPSVASAPNTSRYVDARVKQAQRDLTLVNADIAKQKLEQEKIATRMQKSIDGFMSQKPESIIEVTGPNGTTYKTRPGTLDRYQQGAQARYQIQMNDAEIREVQKMVAGTTSLRQALENLGVTEQRHRALFNNNRLWQSIDDMVNESANPQETLSVILKMLLTTAGGKTQ